MGYALLCDEHTERQAGQYLERQDHDVELVVDVPELGPGTPDAEIRRHARRHDRLVLTSDKGFLTVDQEQHAGILFQPDDRLSAHEVAQIITRISEHLPQDDLTGVVYVTRDWL